LVNLKKISLGSNGDEVPIEIERDASLWKIYFTLTETGKNPF
jgi:hypothetical protein